MLAISCSGHDRSVPIAGGPESPELEGWIEHRSPNPNPSAAYRWVDIMLEVTGNEVEKIGARRSHIVAALGPCIGPDAYEVGPEFEAKFIAQSPENQRFFSRSSTAARPYFDLPAFVLARLGAMQIAKVESCTRCTYSYPDDFFSYRRTTHRSEPDYGRQISAIVLL